MLQHCTVLFKIMWSIIDCCMLLKWEKFYITSVYNDVEFRCYRTSPVTVYCFKHTLLDCVTVAVYCENI
jgi:hypothetical protein